MHPEACHFSDSARLVGRQNHSGPKRVLFVSYPFPPVGGAGVQRTTKFVKYLSEFGWLPSVLTVAKSDESDQSAQGDEGDDSDAGDDTEATANNKGNPPAANKDGTQADAANKTEIINLLKKAGAK